MGTPLELVKYNTSNGKFEVGKDAVEALRGVKGPVGVVAVCGRARQGKSYILNQLLQQASGGFQVGPTHRPCTKGLWMWSQPQLCTLPDGTAHHLVLLDTEGIDAYDQTGQYSTQIFCLAVLLSSLFVYNQMGGIDEAALDRLSLVTEMTKRIRVRANVQGPTAEELAQFTPAFLWLLRDFYLSLEEDGRRITPRDYLETALQPVPGTGPSVEAKNMIRNSIKALFPDRDCFTLVRPMNEEAHLINLDRISRKQLRPEFLQGLERLTSRIFSKASPRRMGDMVVTGPVLAGLVQSYVAAINEGAVPTIATAWQGVAESECRRAVDSAEEVYTREFKGEQVQADEAELEKEHQRALQVALAAFEDIAVGGGGVQKAHHQRLIQVCTSRYEAVKKTRLAEAAATINELLYRANVQLQTALRSGTTTTQQLNQLLKSFLESYLASASGPTKWQRLVEFLQDSFLAAAQELAATNEQKLKQNLAEATKLNQESERKLLDASKQLAGLQQALVQAQQKAAEADALKVQLARREADSGVSLKAKEQQIEALNAQLRDVMAIERKKSQSAEEAAGAKVQLAAQQLKHLQTALETERDKSLQLQCNLELEAARRQSTEAQLAASRQEVEELQRRGLASARQTTTKDQELASLQEAVTRLQADLAAMQSQRDQLQTQLRAQQERSMEWERGLDEQLAEAQQEVQAASSSRSRGARSRGSALASGTEFDGMTIKQLKDWLTQHGHEDKVWTASTATPAYRKDDWLRLVLELTPGNGQAASGMA